MAAEEMKCELGKIGGMIQQMNNKFQEMDGKMDKYWPEMKDIREYVVEDNKRIKYLESEVRNRNMIVGKKKRRKRKRDNRKNRKTTSKTENRNRCGKRNRRNKKNWKIQ